MADKTLPKTLITGATGQVGSKTIEFLSRHNTVEIGTVPAKQASGILCAWELVAGTIPLLPIGPGTSW